MKNTSISIIILGLICCALGSGCRPPANENAAAIAQLEARVKQLQDQVQRCEFFCEWNRTNLIDFSKAVDTNLSQFGAVLYSMQPRLDEAARVVFSLTNRPTARR